MSTRKSRVSDFIIELKLKGFKVFETQANAIEQAYSRKDFYRISLTTGSFVFHYAAKTFVTSERILFFGNPHIPYSCEAFSLTNKSYTCLFSEEFFKVGKTPEFLQQSPLFKIGGTPVLNINSNQTLFISTIFRNMILEQNSDYPFKDDLIRNYIDLIMHEALKMQPCHESLRHQNASHRVTLIFLELLERQFPIDSIKRPLTVRTPRQFAECLSVHVNYLNYAIKHTTGKPTSAVIAERVIIEAKSLLLQTDWKIFEIACSLGFRYPSYFNNFFKKMTGTNPRSLRRK